MRSSTIAHPGPTSNIVCYWIACAYFWFFGWETEGEPPQAGLAVIIAAPHTSNWDMPHMIAAAWIFRMQISWVGKHTLFKPPLGWLLTSLGGISIDRRAPQGAVRGIAKSFETRERLFLAVPPSGTRQKSHRWKSGFYWIAREANVPIVAGYLDYSRRRACLGYMFEPTGVVKADMDRLREFYGPIRGKFPELQSTIAIKEEGRSQIESD
jgi:1-acyl-sn-glycerol-3-phosphate acyltransferase